MIIIPSKSIYAKNNPKIIKNNYSGVSATTQIPRRKRNEDGIVSHIDEVIDESYQRWSPSYGNWDDQMAYSTNLVLNPWNDQAVFIQTEVSDRASITKEFTIPKKSPTITINSINTSSISGNVKGRLNKYKINGEAKGYILHNNDFGVWKSGDQTKVLEGTDYDVLIRTLDSPLNITTSKSFKTDHGAKKNHTVSVTTPLSGYHPNGDKANDTLVKVELLSSTDESYTIKIYVAYASYTYEEWYGKLDTFAVEPYHEDIVEIGFNKDVKGNYEGEIREYIAESIEFSLYGESYEISLLESELFVGDNKSNAFAVQQTNELMQNSPQLQNNIHQIYNQYKDTGKEVATIRCSVVDYFDENGNKVIAQDKDVNLFDIDYITDLIRGDTEVIIETDKESKEIFFFSPFTSGTNFQISFGGNTWNYDAQTERYYIDFTKTDNIDSFVLDIEMYDATNINLIDNLSINTRNISEGYTYAQAIFDLSSIGSGEYSLSFDFNGIPKESTYTISNIKISYRGDTKYTEQDTLPSLFNLYDKVIPMVYTYEGTDKPMSTYTDGSPKVFQVVGNRLIYDGAVWQELTMIEVRQDED